MMDCRDEFDAIVERQLVDAWIRAGLLLMRSKTAEDRQFQAQIMAAELVKQGEAPDTDIALWRLVEAYREVSVREALRQQMVWFADLAEQLCEEEIDRDEILDQIMWFVTTAKTAAQMRQFSDSCLISHKASTKIKRGSQGPKKP
jgi:hypothetical protein